MTDNNVLKFRIGGYFEIYQRHETSHPEEVIEAKDLQEAGEIAKQKFGWGAWGFEIKPCTLCGWTEDTKPLKPYRGRELCDQCYQGEINEPDLALGWAE